MAGKNSQIHIYLETELLEKLKKKAQDSNLSISAFCRTKLKEIPQMEKIEALITEINEKLK